MVILSIARARVGAVGSGRRPLLRLGDEGEDAEAADLQDAVISKTMTSDRRAGAGGGEIDGLVGAKGVVLVTPREELSDEHGSVF